MNYIKKYTDFINENVDSNLLNKLKEKYFNDIVVIGDRVEGYKIYNKIISVGLRIAMKQTIEEALFHEMAHMVEIKDPKRLLVNGFGLGCKTQDSLGYDVPLTWNSTKFESRVVCWQKILCDYYKCNFDYIDFIKAFKYMCDFDNVPLDGCYIDDEYKWYYNDTKEIVEYNKRNDLRLATIKKYVDSELLKTDKYNITNFDSIWNDRMKFIRDSFTK